MKKNTHKIKNGKRKQKTTKSSFLKRRERKKKNPFISYTNLGIHAQSWIPTWTQAHAWMIFA